MTLADFWRAGALGVLQGLTEFLPVSSDGHLTVFQVVFGGVGNFLAMDVVVHGGTLLSMVVFFRKDIFRMFTGLFQREGSGVLERRRFFLIVLCTLVTAVVGFGLKSRVEEMSTSLVAAGMGFLLTAAILLWGESNGKRPDAGRITVGNAPLWHAVALGLFQGLAVWPGLSRSACTIGLALVLGWAWGEAGRFSFLMAMPAIAGAFVLMLREFSTLPLGPAVVSFFVSFLVGLVALRLLMTFLASRRLWPFALYTLGLGVWCLFRGHH